MNHFTSDRPLDVPSATQWNQTYYAEGLQPRKRSRTNPTTNMTDRGSIPACHDGMSPLDRTAHGQSGPLAPEVSQPTYANLPDVTTNAASNFPPNTSQFYSPSQYGNQPNFSNAQNIVQTYSDFVGVPPSQAQFHNPTSQSSGQISNHKRRFADYPEWAHRPVPPAPHGGGHTQPRAPLRDKTNYPSRVQHYPTQQQIQTPLSPATAPALQPLLNFPFLGTFDLVDARGNRNVFWRLFLGRYLRPGQDQSAQMQEEDFFEWARANDPSRSQAANGEVGGQRRLSVITDVTADVSSLRTTETNQSKESIAKLYRGWHKAFRLKADQMPGKYLCTLGCGWSHNNKANWQRHERTHYPQEIWVCNHAQCAKQPVKGRVSFRKDLARRHHIDHHVKEAKHKLPNLTRQQKKAIEEELKDFKLTEEELAQQHVIVQKSKFPKSCVFEGCSEDFETWDDRCSHIERHLVAEDILNKNAIRRFGADESAVAEGCVVDPNVDDTDGKSTLNGRRSNQDKSRKKGKRKKKVSEEESDDEQDNNDDSEDDDGGNDNPDNGSGNTGADSNGPGDHDPGNHPPAPDPSGNPDHAYEDPASFVGGLFEWYNGQPYSHQNVSHWTSASNFDTFAGSGYISSVDPRPWKSFMSLRLQLLPQVFARGLAQTPLVLKKIQLQAALALEASGKKKDQMIKVLRREIAIMACALPLATRPSIEGFPRSAAMTKLVPALRQTIPRYQPTTVSVQKKAILKFSGMDHQLVAEKASKFDNDADDPDDALGDSLDGLHGGQIYRCVRVHSPNPPFRPSRLIHVGSKSQPMLHLDTSEKLPDQVNYCALTHCWDDGDTLSLSKNNMADLVHRIPADGLTQSFHLAINIARDKGIEYVWIDALCIMLDSQEDLISETPRITQTYASATFSIVITSVAFDKTAKCAEEKFEPSPDVTAVWKDFIDRDPYSNTELHGPESQSISISQTPGLTTGPSIADTSSMKQKSSNPTTLADMQENFRPLPRIPIRRGSHQLESFLSEPSKKSSFLPLWPLKRSSAKSPLSSVDSASSEPERSLSGKLSDLELLPRRLLNLGNDSLSSSSIPSLSQGSDSSSVVSTYVDKWQNYWQKLSSKSDTTGPIYDTVVTSSPIASREPSISEMSDQGEKKNRSIAFHVVWRKISGGLMRRDTQHFEMTYGAKEFDD